MSETKRKQVICVTTEQVIQGILDNPMLSFIRVAIIRRDMRDQFLHGDYTVVGYFKQGDTFSLPAIEADNDYTFSEVAIVDKPLAVRELPAYCFICVSPSSAAYRRKRQPLLKYHMYVLSSFTADVANIEKSLESNSPVHPFTDDCTLYPEDRAYEQVFEDVIRELEAAGTDPKLLRRRAGEALKAWKSRSVEALLEDNAEGLLVKEFLNEISTALTTKDIAQRHGLSAEEWMEKAAVDPSDTIPI